jgi:hypothetical protein
MFMVFNPSFNNISVISWRSVLLVEETGVPSSNNKTLNARLIAKYGIDIQLVRPEMTKFKIFKEEIFILWELHSKIL